MLAAATFTRPLPFFCYRCVTLLGSWAADIAHGKSRTRRVLVGRRDPPSVRGGARAAALGGARLLELIVGHDRNDGDAQLRARGVMQDAATAAAAAAAAAAARIMVSSVIGT